MKHTRRSPDSRPVARPQGRGSRQERPAQTDYWDRIANDVASGYGAARKARGRDLLNPDQEPDDARRGDA